jgi:hypothetical protein
MRPGSIRDQVLRGATLVQRMVDQRLLAPGMELAVVGAGAAGVAAALTAVASGVQTTLFEQADEILSRQARAGHRWVEPAAYDWPLDHWETGRLGMAGLPLLPFPAQTADALAKDWAAIVWGEAAQHEQLLKVRTGVAVKDIRLQLDDPGLPGVRVQMADGSVHLAHQVIWAAGELREDTELKPANASRVLHVGTPFWEPDTLDGLGRGKRVIVFGGGDGAAQDALRALTGLSVSAPGKPPLQTLLQRLHLPKDVMHAVQSAEDRAQRGRAWCPPGKPPEGGRDREMEWLERLHAAHLDAVDAALSHEVVTDAMDALVTKARPIVHLVHRGTSLSCGYAANRFLVLLFDRWLQRRNGKPLLYLGVTIAGMEKQGNRHVPILAPGNPAATIPRPGTAYDGVVVRFGVTDTSSLPQELDDALPPIRRHLLPLTTP